MPDLGSVLSNAKCDIFIINLNRRKDRWDKIFPHLLELNCFEFTRVAAVDGLKEPKILAQKIRKLDRECCDEPTLRQMGALGCLKSHLKALKLALNFFGECDKALILEDDCFFIDIAADVLVKSISELPSDWQVLMLGGVYGSAPGYIFNKTSLMRVYNATGAHAYMVNKSSCQFLIERIQNLLESEIILPVDELFTQYQSTYPWYATHPFIAGQYSDYSDIESCMRTHSDSCFKLGIKISLKHWVWMKIRPHLPIELIKNLAWKINNRIGKISIIMNVKQK